MSMRPVTGCGSPDERAGKIGVVFDRLVDPARQGRAVGIERADHDPGVCRTILMELPEVAPVQRDDRSPLCGRELEDLGIRHSPAGVAAVAHGHRVVPQAAELEYHRLGQILVREEPRRDSRRFVRGDLRG
jgi:hypothetical protein